MLKMVKSTRVITRIHFPRGSKFQTISYYVYNITLTITKEENNLCKVVSFLEDFLFVNGLELNWGKSLAYWSYKKVKERLGCTYTFKWNGLEKMKCLNS